MKGKRSRSKKCPKQDESNTKPVHAALLLLPLPLSLSFFLLPLPLLSLSIPFGRRSERMGTGIAAMTVGGREPE
jgi:hypothetical protein